MLLLRAIRANLFLLAFICTIIFLLYGLTASPSSSHWQAQSNSQYPSISSIEGAESISFLASYQTAPAGSDVSARHSNLPAPTSRFFPFLENITYLSPILTSSPTRAFATIRILSKHTITHTHTHTHTYVPSNRPFNPKIDLASTTTLHPRSIGDHDYLCSRSRSRSLTTHTTTKMTSPTIPLNPLLHDLPLPATTGIATTATATTTTTPNDKSPIHPRESPTLRAFGIALAGLFFGVGIGLIVKACCRPFVMSWGFGVEELDRRRGEGHGVWGLDMGRGPGCGFLGGGGS